MVKRKIVKIDEELCDGCGKCIAPCAEGAIELRDGKAHVIREELCDGAGFCLGVCPTGALSIEERKAEPFSEKAVKKHLAEQKPQRLGHEINCFSCGVDDAERALLPARKGGEAIWVCTRCLPGLIHGGE